MPADFPLLSRFDVDISDDDLDEAIRIRVSPIADLPNLSVEAAENRLEEALRTLVVPTPQMRYVIRRMTAAAYRYSELVYPDEKTFLQHVYYPPASTTTFPICITSLAGVGKSEIISAFTRLHDARRSVEVQGHSCFPLKTAWHIKVNSDVGIRQLLGAHFRHSGGTKHIIPKAAEEAAAQGTALIVADEFQFQSGSEANARTSKLLLQLSGVGPPLVFATNFSLLHRLNRRPQEERQRLLAKPILIVPDSAESPAWKSYVDEAFSIAPEFSALRETQNIAENLHRYTFGIRRSLALLLRIAYVHMRRRKATRILPVDLESANGSLEFASTREDVEALIRGSIQQSTQRKDLCCPLKGLEIATTGNVSEHPAAGEHRRRSSEEALRSTLSRSEREGLEAASRQQETGSVKPFRPPRQQRPPATVDNLLDGARKFNESGEKPRVKR